MAEEKVETNEKVLDYTDSKEEILDINGVSTKILYIKAENIPENAPKTVVIVVPGIYNCLMLLLFIYYKSQNILHIF